MICKLNEYENFLTMKRYDTFIIINGIFNMLSLSSSCLLSTTRHNEASFAINLILYEILITISLQ